jgi:hypothetical protein
MWKKTSPPLNPCMTASNSLSFVNATCEVNQLMQQQRYFSLIASVLLLSFQPDSCSHLGDFSYSCSYYSFRDRQEQRGVDSVRRRLRGEKRGKNTRRVNRIGRPLRGEERRKERQKVKKTCRVHRIGRPLRGEEKGHRDRKEQSSGDRVRRRLDGDGDGEPIKAAKKKSYIIKNVYISILWI